jgi:hypothetical protein
MTTLFDAPVTAEEVTVSIDDLVGEGQKYKTVEDLVKAVVFKDQHITRLETENRGMRDDLRASKRLEEVVEQLSKVAVGESPANSGGNQSERERGDAPALSAEDLEQLIDQGMTKREKAARQRDNLGEVSRALANTWGSNYAAQLREQAKVLGVGEDFLNSVAAENPQAFYRLVGLQANAPVPSVFAPPASAVNSTGIQTRKVNDRTETYYADLKKKDPALYWSPKVQNQMHADAFRLEEKFFDKG